MHRRIKSQKLHINGTEVVCHTKAQLLKKEHAVMILIFLKNKEKNS